MTYQIKNAILRLLPANELEQILRKSENVRISAGDRLCEPNSVLNFINFPESGTQGLLMVLNNREVEVANIAYEGFTGVHVILHSRSASWGVTALSAGSSYRMQTDDFLAAYESCPIFRNQCLKYAAFLFEQIAFNSVCSRIHSVQERWAKWLLFCADRCDSEGLIITQDLLAKMLGVQRQSINLAATALQNQRAITYSRGAITLHDRGALEKVSCKCYSALQTSLKLYLSAPQKN